MDDVLLGSMPIDEHKSLDWLGWRVEDIGHTIPCLVVPSEDLDGLLEDRSPFGGLLFFCVGHHGSLEVGGGTYEVGCVNSSPLDLSHHFVCGGLSIMEDLREEGVLIVGGRHGSEEIILLSLVCLLLSCKIFSPWS